VFTLLAGTAGLEAGLMGATVQVLVALTLVCLLASLHLEALFYSFPFLSLLILSSLFYFFSYYFFFPLHIITRDSVCFFFSPLSSARGCSRRSQ
jgi:hypothetical protein